MFHNRALFKYIYIYFFLLWLLYYILALKQFLEKLLGRVRGGGTIASSSNMSTLINACSGGTAVIEMNPLAVTVPALILMAAEIIAHAIKEVQMLSGSAHIIISQCNTSLIFVVIF